MKNYIILICVFSFLFLNGCTIYTEKRSESLSRAVAATSDSIDAARFDLADKYSKEAIKLAYQPKNKIKINSIFTKKIVKLEIAQKEACPTPSPLKVNSKWLNLLTPKPSLEDSDLRIVVSEKLKDAILLIEKSDEWNELIKTKAFADSLKKDNDKLINLKKDVEDELLKQNVMKEKMIRDLNSMQKKLVEKDLFILRLEVALAGVSLLFLLCGYLRIKGVL